MKFTTVLSLALSALQVQATPADAAEAVSPVNGFCCVVLQNPENNIAQFIPLGGIYSWKPFGTSCEVVVARKPHGCDWQFYPTKGCDYLAKPLSFSTTVGTNC
ncbi:hypothetical protein E4U55_003647 [Claviceps digitariae]|nr:hypothetical protein E4U55_003647 [Claviceps digitariae]